MASLLVVDDSADICALYEQEFTEDGHEVMLSTSAAQALEQLKSHHPDVIILDIGMPDMNGLELLKILSDRGDNTPVILNTAYSELGEDCTAKPVAARVLKSGDLTVLKKEIAKVLTAADTR